MSGFNPEKPDFNQEEPEYNPEEYQMGDHFSSEKIKQYENRPEAGMSDEDVYKYLEGHRWLETVKGYRKDGFSWSEIAARHKTVLDKLKGNGKDSFFKQEDIPDLQAIVDVASGASGATEGGMSRAVKGVETGPSNEARLYDQLRELGQKGNRLAQAVSKGWNMARVREGSIEKVRADMQDIMNGYVDRYQKESGLEQVLEDEREVRKVLDRWFPLRPE